MWKQHGIHMASPDITEISVLMRKTREHTRRLNTTRPFFIDVYLQTNHSPVRLPAHLQRLEPKDAPSTA